MKINEVTQLIIEAAIEVHRILGPGMLESVYEACLCAELALRGLRYERQKAIPVDYKGAPVDCGFRVDLLVEGRVVVEIKVLERIHPVHRATVLTYLKFSGCTVGLLMNFNFKVLTQGVTRLVLGYKEE